MIVVSTRVKMSPLKKLLKFDRRYLSQNTLNKWKIIERPQTLVQKRNSAGTTFFYITLNRYLDVGLYAKLLLIPHSHYLKLLGVYS